MSKSKASPGRKALRFLGCLIKAPLGCLAFFIGAAVVFVIFFPPAIGSFAARELEAWFARTHQGAIEVDQAWLGSLYGPQKIERVALRDPEQNEILHATVRAPSLSPLLFEGEERWGPVEIHVPNVRLVRDAAGVSNLARALDRRTERHLDDDVLDRTRREIQTSLRAIDVVIRIDRLGWEDAAGRSVRMSGVVCEAEIDLRSPRARLSLTGNGALVDADADPLSFELELSELFTWGARGAAPPWSFELSCGRAPASAVEALLGSFGRLELAFGPTIEELELELTGRGAEVRRLSSFALRSETAEVELSGHWQPKRGLLQAGADDEGWVRFAVDSWWWREVVPRILPPTQAADVRGFAGRAALELEDFTVPLDGDLRAVTGRCRLELGERSYAVVLPR